MLSTSCRTAACLSLLALGSAVAEEDPYLWLEEVENAEALAWAGERSRADTAVLEAVPEYEALHREMLEIYNSSDRIPDPGIRGEWIYNFWRDADHVRGIWRRTSLDGFVEPQPVWEVVLDVDALAEREGENWVWKGANCLPPEYRRCMVTLSRGGADAAEEREFDLTTKSFVDGGFRVPEAKTFLSWKDDDTLWIGTDAGEGSLTTSGYPRFVREWRRGTPIGEATTLFEAGVEDVYAAGAISHTPEGRYDVVLLVPEFFRESYWIRLGERLVRLDLPADIDMRGIFKDRLVMALRSDWEVSGTTYPQGALVSIGLDDLLAGSRALDLLFEPSERVSLDSVANTRNHLIVSTLDQVRSRLYRYRLGDDGWSSEEIELPGLGTVRIGSASETDDTFFFTYTDLVTPSSLYLVRDGAAPRGVKSEPAWFDADGVEVVQNEAVSKDGTRIPYFLMTPRGFGADGTAPTLLTAYGGFEVANVPTYRGTVGRAWVERGGVYVLANIRGGGEFGPKWHEAAVREKHQTNFDDLIAVAEDLVERGITSPDHLGILGGSQGGLLVGGAFTQRPDLFEAVVCAVPLLDMKRYNKLLAGASWMSEYGNPDTGDWEYIKLWSPYQNLDGEADYPEVFFWTNTRDDRVHPGHARKMVAKMTDLGHKVFYYENTEGGHGGGANLNQRAYTDALTYAYLWMKLRNGTPPAPGTGSWDRGQEPAARGSAAR
jgi:prolyl oligopeptidase